jgi:hypothetical protein
MLSHAGPFFLPSVDYSRPWSEIYMAIAQGYYYIKSDWKLPGASIFLHLICFGSLASINPNFLSWVPNWSASRTRQYIAQHSPRNHKDWRTSTQLSSGRFLNGESMNCRFYLHEKNFVHISAKLDGKVNAVSTSFTETLDAVDKCYGPDLRLVPLKTDMIDLLHTVLLSDRDRLLIPIGYDYDQEYEKHMGQGLEHAEAEEQLSNHMCVEMLESYNRSFDVVEQQTRPENTFEPEQRPWDSEVIEDTIEKYEGVQELVEKALKKLFAFHKAFDFKQENNQADMILGVGPASMEIGDSIIYPRDLYIRSPLRGRNVSIGLVVRPLDSPQCKRYMQESSGCNSIAYRYIGPCYTWSDPSRSRKRVDITLV